MRTSVLALAVLAGCGAPPKVLPGEALPAAAGAPPEIERPFALAKLRLTRPSTIPYFSNLNARIVFNPALRERLLQVIERGLGVFDPAVLEGRIDAMHALIRPHVARHPVVDQQKFLAGREFLKLFVAQRVAFVRSELARHRGHSPAPTIEAFDPREGWIELGNRGAAPASLAGKVVTTNLREALGGNLPAMWLAPGERVRLLAGELGLAFPAEGEVGLFDGASVAVALDVLFYGQLPAGLRYRRDAGGAWRAE